MIPLRLRRVLGAMEALAGCRGNLASSSSLHSSFLASSSRRIVLQSGSSRRRVVVVGCPVICSASQKIETEPTKTTSSQPYPGGLGPHTGRDPTVKKPSWLRQRAPQGEKLAKLKESITTLKLNTVCEEAQCPNIGEVHIWLHSHGHFERRESVLPFFIFRGFASQTIKFTDQQHISHIDFTLIQPHETTALCQGLPKHGFAIA